MIFLAATALSLLGYHLTFDAEMTSPSDMSQFINSFANGNTTLWNNKEAENYVPYNASSSTNPYAFVNGALVITASPIPSNNLPYTSGMLCTAGIFSQSSGYFEIRAETPAAQGFWPAFWMLPNGAGYPEIDIMEQPNNSGTVTEYWTHTSTPTNSSGGFTNTHVNVTQGYHTYGFMWTPTTIQYVFDGAYVGSPQSTPPSLNGLAMYLLANLAVGGEGSWPGPPLAGAVSTYSIDYVRAFSNDPAVPTVSQEPISSPDGIDTTPVLTPPAPPVPDTIGNGSDALVLFVAEDAYDGNAKFTIAIDGVQKGGTLTARAMNSAGQTQAFTVLGNFGTKPHSVTVTFLNNANGVGGDRNLYVNGATLNGVPITGAYLEEYATGPQSFAFKAEPPAPVSIGTGPDTFLFAIAEDAMNGNAKYTISIDGQQQGGIQTAKAAHADGQSQTVAVMGNFGPGPHTEVIKFLNGAPSGSTSPSRNLYLESVTYNGFSTPDGTASLTNTGTATIATPMTGPDTLTIGMTEDAYAGDAQAEIMLDGQLLGTPTVTYLNSAGTAELFTYTGNFGGPTAQHTALVNFLNDLYIGPGQDRNLYVQSITFDGVQVAGPPTAIMRDGPVSFGF
jgi:beta-glucanase (GH16 family)